MWRTFVHERALGGGLFAAVFVHKLRLCDDLSTLTLPDLFVKMRKTVLMVRMEMIEVTGMMVNFASLKP